MSLIFFLILPTVKLRLQEGDSQDEPATLFIILGLFHHLDSQSPEMSFELTGLPSSQLLGYFGVILKSKCQQQAIGWLQESLFLISASLCSSERWRQWWLLPCNESVLGRLGEAPFKRCLPQCLVHSSHPTHLYFCLPTLPCYMQIIIYVLPRKAHETYAFTHQTFTKHPPEALSHFLGTGTLPSGGHWVLADA